MVFSTMKKVDMITLVSEKVSLTLCPLLFPVRLIRYLMAAFLLSIDSEENAP